MNATLNAWSPRALAALRIITGLLFLAHGLIKLFGFPEGALVATADMAGRILNNAQQALNGTLAAQKTRGVEVAAVLKSGEPRETILAVAKDLDADLIVIGTHGRRGLAHMLLGSVAEYIVRTSPQPVLTVRCAAAEDKTHGK